MLTTSCPKCEKEVTLPVGASAASRVRCPLCSEEYTLEGVFEKLPPLLVLLDAPRSNGLAAHAVADQMVIDEAAGADRPGDRSMFDFEGGPSPATSSFGEKLDDGGDIALADAPETTPASSSFDFGPESAPAAATLSTGTMSSTRATARPRRKVQGGMLKQVIGIVVGGLVAAPIAQMILMWMPGKWEDQQRDPLGLAPKIASVLPWIVPQHLRTETGEGAVEQPAPLVVAQRPDQGGSRGTTGGNTTNPPDKGFPDLGGALKKPDDNPKDPSDGGNSSSGGNENPPDTNPNNPDPPVDPDPTTDPDPLDLDPPTTDDPPPDVEGAPLGPKKAPTFAADALLEEIKSAAEAKELIGIAAQPDGDGKQKRESAESFLATMNALAHVVTFAAERPTGHVEHLQDILKNASDLPKKRKIIGTMAAAELDAKNKKRTSPGLVLAGSVKEIQPRGQLFEAIIELDSQSKRPVSVYSKGDPAGAFEVGDLVIILGEIIDQPNQSLDGYKGPDEPVIWGGYSQVVKP